MRVQIKRAYDPPEKSDGKRYLIDRLWPRGKTKTSLKLEAWIKEVAPSNALRKWFGHKPSRWKEFEKRYLTELKAMDPAVWKPLSLSARKEKITLVYGAKDPLHNQAVVLAKFLSKKR